MDALFLCFCFVTCACIGLHCGDRVTTHWPWGGVVVRLRLDLGIAFGRIFYFFKNNISATLRKTCESHNVSLPSIFVVAWKVPRESWCIPRF